MSRATSEAFAPISRAKWCSPIESQSLQMWLRPCRALRRWHMTSSQSNQSKVSIKNCVLHRTLTLQAGALVYYLRRVLHDWPDEDCVNILKNVAAGMDPGKSRLVICELVVPPVGASAEACWTDITMMTFSGTERTASQYDKLLAAAGLKPVKVHTAHGTNYGAIEARLQ